MRHQYGISVAESQTFLLPKRNLSGDKQGETSAVRRLLLASKNYVLVLVVSLGRLWSNSPRSIDQNFNVTPRLYGQKLQNSHDSIVLQFPKET